MIAQVNLLPHARRHRRDHRARVRFWVMADLVVIGVAAALIGFALTVRPATAATRAAIAELEGEIADAKAELGEIAPLVTRDRQTLEAIRQVSDQPNWSILLTLLGRLRDEQAVLRSVRIEPIAPEGGSIVAAALSAQDRQGGTSVALRRPAAFAVRLDGLAQSQADVSRIVLACERSELFAAVKLVNTSRQAFMGRETTRFEIECRIGLSDAQP